MSRLFHEGLRKSEKDVAGEQAGGQGRETAFHGGGSESWENW